MTSDVHLENLLDESKIAQQRQRLVTDNSILVESYFNNRANSFIKNVICKHFKVNDYRYRFEYQHRGSCHLHGVLWLHGAADPKIFDTASEAEMLQAKTYYDNLVSAFNPLPSTTPALVHPSRNRSTDVQLDNDIHVSRLLNRLQRHTLCTKGYCLRWNGCEFVCRFKFPKNLQEESTLQKNDKTHFVYLPKRNDEKLN